jgi:hypothetical protein
MDEGYAARRGGDLALFHALLVVDQLERLPQAFARDLDYVRLMLDLSEREFNEAVALCEHYAWLRWADDDPPEPLH